MISAASFPHVGVRTTDSSGGGGGSRGVIPYWGGFPPRRGVVSEWRRTDYRFQRRERRIRVHHHVSGRIPRWRRSEHRFLGHSEPVGAAGQYAVHSRVAERFDPPLGARAGNAHKSAAFLEEERLIGDVWPYWLVNRVNCRPGFGDHVTQFPIVDPDAPRRRGFRIADRRGRGVSPRTAAADNTSLGRAPRASDFHDLQLLPKRGDRQPKLPTPRLNQPEVPILFNGGEPANLR